jgi:hypothetical protein
MDEINTICPKCGQKISGPKDLEGQFVDCPFCESSFQFKKPKGNFFTSVKLEPKEGIWNKNYGCGTGIFIIFIFFIFIVLIGHFSSDREENSGPETQQSQTQQSQTQQSQTQQSQTQRSQTQQSIFRERQTVKIGKFYYHVDSSRWSDFIDGRVRPDSKFLYVLMTIQNGSNKPETIPEIQLLDQFGNTHESSIKTYRLDNYIRGNDLNPGVTKKGTIVFDVPNDRNYSLQIPTDYWESEFGYILLEPK